MKTNLRDKVNTQNPDTNKDSKVGEIGLGIDLHAAKAVVSVQLDGCPPQPPQRIAAVVPVSSLPPTATLMGQGSGELPLTRGRTACYGQSARWRLEQPTGRRA